MNGRGIENGKRRGGKVREGEREANGKRDA